MFNTLSKDNIKLGLSATIVIGILVFYVVSMHPGHRMNEDFALYLGHARSLAQGTGYKETQVLWNPRLVNPDDSDVAVPGPAMYPPGAPLVYALVFPICDLTLSCYKLVNISFWGLAGIILLFYARWKAYPQVIGLCSVIIFLAHPAVLQAKDEIGSDAFFALLLVSSIWLTELLSRPARNHKASTAISIALGAVLAFALATRTVAVVLVAACAIFYVVSRKKITVFLAVPCVMAFTAYAWLGVFSGSSYDYLSNYSWFEWTGNFNRYRWAYTDALSGVPGGKLLTIIMYCGFAFAVIGAVRTYSRNPFAIFFLGYLFFLLVLPSIAGPAPRYMIPLYPWLGFLIWEGVSWPVEHRKKRQFSTGIIVSVTASIIVSSITTRNFSDADDVMSPERQALYSFLKKETIPTDVIAARKNRALALFASRPAIRPHKFRDFSEINEWIRVWSVKHIVLRSEDQHEGPSDESLLFDFLSDGVKKGTISVRAINSEFSLFTVIEN